MTERSGDLLCLCLFLCLFGFVLLGYKVRGSVGVVVSLLPSSSSPLLPLITNHVFPSLYFLPIFVQGGRLRPRRGGIYGTGRGSR